MGPRRVPISSLCNGSMDMVREKKGGRFNVSEKQDSGNPNTPNGWPGLDNIMNDISELDVQPEMKSVIDRYEESMDMGAARDRKTVILSVLDSCKNGQINLASDAARLMIANLIDAALNEDAN